MGRGPSRWTPRALQGAHAQCAAWRGAGWAPAPPAPLPEAPKPKQQPGAPGTVPSTMLLYLNPPTPSIQPDVTVEWGTRGSARDSPRPGRGVFSRDVLPLQHWSAANAGPVPGRVISSPARYYLDFTCNKTITQMPAFALSYACGGFISVTL